ncbi:uncharacterized protein [Montipora capricornis]|uniref:uncharacterized protein n=1 Tax=Montipora capricornis TaxID=246305 RepID=UPI0035F13B3F
MELVGEDQDDDDSTETRLLYACSENCLCVCSKAWGKDLLCGWTPSNKKPISRAKPAKTPPSFGNAKKEGKLAINECGFVFRHYETMGRYIEQYRENHSSACLEKEAEWTPVLGVDVPDPYLLPKIGTSSNTFDRVKFIEAMSDYFKVAALRSDLQKICLTGKRAANGDHKTDLSNGTKLDNQGLPIITTAFNGKHVSRKLEQRETIISKDKEKEMRISDEKSRNNLVRTAPALTKASVLPTVPGKPNLSHQIQQKPVVNSAGNRSKGAELIRRNQRERIRLPKFQWTERPVKDKRNIERRFDAKKVEKKDAKQTELFSTSDSDDNVARKLISRGSLRLGSNVQSHKSSPKRQLFQGNVSKCEVYSSNAPNTSESLQKPCQTGTCIPNKTTFIQIFGQQTGPPPKVASKARSKVNRKEGSRTKDKSMANPNLPLQYLTKFGRTNFHHVLEARSFKPGGKKLGATALADFRS